MKIYKFIFTIALVISALVLNNSCNTDNLELVNPNELSPETYFKTEAQVQASVNAVYANLQTRGLYNRHIWFGFENMAHENSGNPPLEADKRQYLNFSFDASHGAIGAFWESCYRGINKANFVINNEEKINEIADAFLPAVRKAKFIGEAQFLRAYYYFLLVNQFGAVPLVTEEPTGSGLARSATGLVWAQIISDLTSATTKCLSKDVEENGRATSEAAWALLGTAYLYQGQYQDAMTAFNNIYDVYALEDRYLNNFEEETEHGPESIFEVVFTTTIGNANQWDSDRTGAGLNESTFRGQEYGWNNWFNVYPSTDLTAEFEAGDPRYGFCFYSNGDLFNNGANTVALPLSRNAGWRKYQNYYKTTDEQMASGINFKVLRYADVLLMMAEAEANRPGGTLADAIGYLNEVRARADVNMPAVATPASIEAFMDVLEHERKVELCGEQKRWLDLVRWDRLADFITEVTPSLPSEEQPPALVFNAATHYLWPIPQGEIDNNDNISQEDQNFGY